MNTQDIVCTTPTCVELATANGSISVLVTLRPEANAVMSTAHDKVLSVLLDVRISRPGEMKSDGRIFTKMLCVAKHGEVHPCLSLVNRALQDYAYAYKRMSIVDHLLTNRREHCLVLHKRLLEEVAVQSSAAAQRLEESANDTRKDAVDLLV